MVSFKSSSTHDHDDVPLSLDLIILFVFSVRVLKDMLFINFYNVIISNDTSVHYDYSSLCISIINIYLRITIVGILFIFAVHKSYVQEYHTAPERCPSVFGRV